MPTKTERKKTSDGMCLEVVPRNEQTVLACGLAVAILMRCVVAVFPHSGEGVPPMYGDYEAQRHWMEITTALPVEEWYVNTSNNDLLYWGLDYPPITAYHSWLLGKVGHRFVPECFVLRASRGHESAGCRVFMRASVIISDLLVYLPCTLWAVHCFADASETGQTRALAVLAFWLLPPLLLIDHGHFQYNGICLGLCMAAAGCVACGRRLLASVIFTAGLLFKQIALYYAPAFFFGILAQCLRPPCTPLGKQLCRIIVTGVVVLGTATIIFAPWLLDREPVAAVKQVIHRMFPFNRGLYEDKVANVWCSISVVIKLQRLLPAARIAPFCALVTLLGLLPANLCCLSSAPGHAVRFVTALFVSSMSFFLFAFQVHEKAVLFPCLAASLLPVALGPSRRPLWAFAALAHFWVVSLFSMYPLVVKDKLQVPYVVFCVLLVLAIESSSVPKLGRIGMRASLVLGLLFHAVHALVRPPTRYPDLWTMLITGSSCAYLLGCFLATTAWQVLSVTAGQTASRYKND